MLRARKDMPQLKGKDVKNLEEKDIRADKLKPQQVDFDPDKVERIKRELSKPNHPIKPIVISYDYKIIDGHHR